MEKNIKDYLHYYMGCDCLFQGGDQYEEKDRYISKMTPQWYYRSGGRLDWMKPILYPLTSLTKEIEIDGKKFIPLVELLNIENELPYVKRDYKILECNSKFYDVSIGKEWFHSIKYAEFDEVFSFSYSEGFRRFISRNETEKRPLATGKQLDMFQKMFEWNFDLFGLIESNLAIDKTTLKNNYV